MLKRLTVVLVCLVVAMVGLSGCGKSNSTKHDPEVDSGYNSNENNGNHNNDHNDPDDDDTDTGIKNVIVMIGDGFGPNHLTNAKRYFGINKFAYEDDYICAVTTRSLDSTVTDSAAAATALATGRKVNNYEVGQHLGEDIENIMEIARASGKKTGIMTSDELYGATPAAYSAHTYSRNNAEEIMLDQMQSGIDIFVGARGSDLYNDVYFEQGFREQGYTYLDKASQLANLDPNQKYLATFDSLQSPCDSNVVGDYPAAITNVLNYLDNENGFCLMIENAYIDKYSHGNYFNGAMWEVRYFAEMIEAVYQFCANRNDTVVIITADHETGGLQLGTGVNNLNDQLYTTTNHTEAYVNLYIKYPTDDKRKNYKTYVSNTQIFKICQTAVREQIFDLTLILDD